MVLIHVGYFVMWELWLTSTLYLSQNVLLFSCHPISQLCLGGSGYRSHTVILYSAAFMEFTHYTVQTGDDWMSDVGYPK